MNKFENTVLISNKFEDTMLISKELINKVKQLSNPTKVDNWLKEICLYQQLEIEMLHKRIQELEMPNNVKKC